VKDIFREVTEEDYVDWTEIMTGPEMESWIESNDNSLWIEMFPGIYWIHPKLYVWYKLRYN
jgi:hypothetical protein